MRDTPATMEGWSVPTELADEDVALRAWRPSDAGWLHEAFSDAAVQSQTEQADGLSVDSVETALSMIAEAGRRARRGEGVGLAICRAVDGEPVGSLELSGVPGREREAEIECLVLAEHRRHGYATSAVKLATAWALGALGLDRLWADIDAANAASLAVVRTVGYREPAGAELPPNMPVRPTSLVFSAKRSDHSFP
jgi:RimJ/RimL family protein N-acetyltransferase